MDNPKRLDEYLAGLGISEADETALPELPQGIVRPPDALFDQLAGVPGDAAGRGEGPERLLGAFLSGLLDRLDPGLTFEVRHVTAEDGGNPEGRRGGEALEIEIRGEGAPRLAAQGGRLLTAAEVLCYAVLSRQGHGELRVRLDAGGFRRRHAENLTRVAERVAAQVAKSGEAHEMQPMSPADRRVMHLALQEHPLVTTESIGEGTSRRLLILPKGAS